MPPAPKRVDVVVVAAPAARVHRQLLFLPLLQPRKRMSNFILRMGRGSHAVAAHYEQKS